MLCMYRGSYTRCGIVNSLESIGDRERARRVRRQSINQSTRPIPSIESFHAYFVDD